ncbi:hypothetical protein ABZ499_11105 [Streptomyces sp. NPDC019990]|uniref:hypothetical protein n=1 Tax=Streptomyces sp. NPDC019990 TaxID=3154693 RepID=UPI0033C8985A
MRKITSVSRKAAGLAAVGIIAVTASAAMAIPAQAAPVRADTTNRTIWPNEGPIPVIGPDLRGLGPAVSIKDASLTGA